MLVSILLIVE